MNWTGGKRNKIKVKLELQKQKEFFNRQRLKKVHSFLSIEPRLTRALSSIDVVRRSETFNNNLSDTKEPSDIDIEFQHTEKGTGNIDKFELDDDNIDRGLILIHSLNYI
ncbi:6308_t:CDS:2 [Funneliformis caledonium]|uniref:6308_t:CDS:1 n=1 Tax=Funneliformis caledonium TaxID=1117310 RepID=A0A9N8V1W3_9GLOM|nr:6308_t:CDS:2 [Funneliformis caledonium]